MLGFLVTSVSRPNHFGQRFWRQPSEIFRGDLVLNQVDRHGASHLKFEDPKTSLSGMYGSGVVPCCHEHVVRDRTFSAMHHGLGLECAAELVCCGFL